MGESRHVGDVRSLEEVFRSQERRRPPRAIAGDSGSFVLAEGAADATARELDSALMPEGFSETVSSGGGVALGETDAAVAGEPGWKRGSGWYWTIAAMSALVAIVVAGATAGVGHHGPSNGSAQGLPVTVRPHGGVRTPVAASIGPTTPESLTGVVGSGALTLSAPSAEARGFASEPGGRVTLSGATNGTLPEPSRAVPGAGSTSASPGPTAGSPVPPPPARAGSTVARVGSSVAGLANQLGTTLPVATPATNAMSGVVNSVDQAVNAATL